VIVRLPDCSLPRPRRRGTAAAAWPAGPLARPPCRPVPSGADGEIPAHAAPRRPPRRRARHWPHRIPADPRPGQRQRRRPDRRPRHPAAGREVRPDVARLDQRHPHPERRHLVRKSLTQALQGEPARAAESPERNADHAPGRAPSARSARRRAPARRAAPAARPARSPRSWSPAAPSPPRPCPARPPRPGPAPAQPASAPNRPPPASTPATPTRTESSSSTSTTRPAHPPAAVPRLLAPVTAQPAARSSPGARPADASDARSPAPASLPRSRALRSPSRPGSPADKPVTASYARHLRTRPHALVPAHSPGPDRQVDSYCKPPAQGWRTPSRNRRPAAMAASRDFHGFDSRPSHGTGRLR
jgi:hypothetical protein